MGYLTQNKKTGYWTELGGGYQLTNVHDPALCADSGCGIHNHPSDHPLKDAPLLWRTDRGILERVCEHGVGHSDADSAEYLRSIGLGYENTHGCDLCCCEFAVNKR
jgi:hypothetical protein